MNKKVTRGRRKSKQDPSNDLKFVVVKSVPRLEGSIHPLVEKAYAGDIRHLVLELRNGSEFCVKNLKMKISHPRFLCVGSQEDLSVQFPACLEESADVEQSAVYARPNTTSNNTLISFPEEILVQGEKPFLWPLWLRAATPGNISLYISIYYEIGDVTSAIRYRTLRMQYNLQVFPSLDVSFKITPCPSKLEQFLVCMDVVNRTSLMNFQVHQLSAVGHQWEISLLQPMDAIFPSQSLNGGEACSCFFILKSRCRSVTTEDKASPSLLGTNVRLGPLGDRGVLFDISRSPLADFHNHEKLQQGIFHQEDTNTVDFILISRLQGDDIGFGSSEESRFFSYHGCHCSTTSTSPISWVLDGPQTIHHNFSSFCEIKLRMTIHNSSDAVAYVCIKTYDSPGSSAQFSDANAAGNHTGWHDVSLANDVKVGSDVTGTSIGKSLSLESVSPFIWSGSSSTSIEVKPVSSVEIPLQICVFSPGTYDLSSYVLKWNLLPSINQENHKDVKQSSGTCQGYPYYLTVLKSA